MVAFAPNEVLDAIPEKVASATRLCICSAAPSTFGGIDAVLLAQISLTPGAGNGDFAVTNGDISGRKVTLVAQSGIPITASGTATHLVLDDGAALILVTECVVPKPLTSGGTISIAPWKLEVAAPESAYIPPQVFIWGAAGDSQTDEYQADDERGPEVVQNWLEMLVSIRGLDFGEWSDSSRGEPRREGYANNWARSGATMSQVLSNQIPGLAAQIESGAVTHGILFYTGNEWANMSPFLMTAIYNGNGTQTSAGTPLSTVVSDLSGQYISAMNTLNTALNTAGTGGGVAVLTPPHFLAHPRVFSAFPDATRRGWVGTVVAAIYDAVAAHAQSLNSTSGYTRFSVLRADHHMLGVWATGDGQYVTACGVQLDYVNDWEYDPVTYDPYAFALAPTTGSAHTGTIGNGIFARTVIEAINQLPGVSITQLTDQEILEAAGIDSGPAELSAGTIATNPGENSIQVVQEDAPSGGTGEYTLQLYRSTSDDVLGSAISGATSLPYTDNTVTPEVPYYYTLEVDDGEDVAYSPPVSGTAGGGGGGEVTPNFEQNFDYASTAALIGDNSQWTTAEDFYNGKNNGQGIIELVSGGGYDGRANWMRYTFNSFASPGQGGSISRQVPLGSNLEVCVEWSWLFDENFQLDWGYTGGPALKGAFLNITNPPSGRIGIGFEGSSGSFTLHGPDDVLDISHFDTGVDLLGYFNDQQWHRVRVQARVGSSGFIRCQVDNRAWVNGPSFNTAATVLRGFTFGRNINMRPLSPIWYGWGHFRFWTAANKPSWAI